MEQEGEEGKEDLDPLLGWSKRRYQIRQMMRRFREEFDADED